MGKSSLFGTLFISAGAMKAGTTWLYAVLQHHPELFFTCEKEIHYFYARYVKTDILSEERRLKLAKTRYIDTIDPNKSNIDRIRLNLNWVSSYLNRPVDDYWYANLFSAQRKETYGCDFSNLYALLPVEAWQHIAANSEKLRVLYTLRHPLERLWSHIKFHLQLIDKIELLETWQPKDYEEFVKRPFMWQNAEYGAALRRMKKGLNVETIKVVFFEEMRNDSRTSLNEIENFLDIKPHNYQRNILDQQVNKSISRPMPDFFPELFQKDIERLNSEVEDEGLILPESWKH